MPTEEFPDHNFFGVIVGPRGNTQKRLQKETGCKIAMRGRDQSKIEILPGMPPPTGEDAEPLHVFITAPDKKSLNKGIQLIEGMIKEVTSPEGAAIHFGIQIELASKMNSYSGAGWDYQKCRICGNMGHPIWKCPEKIGEEWKPADIQCDICGEVTHLTKDCKYRDKHTGKAKEGVVINGRIINNGNNGNGADIEDELSAFLDDLIGDTPNMSGSRNAKRMAAITGPIRAAARNGGHGNGSISNRNSHSNSNNGSGSGVIRVNSRIGFGMNSINNNNNNNNNRRGMISSSSSVFGKQGERGEGEEGRGRGRGIEGKIDSESDYHNVPPPCQSGAKAPASKTLPMPTFNPNRIKSNNNSNNNNNSNLNKEQANMNNTPNRPSFPRFNNGNGNGNGNSSSSNSSTRSSPVSRGVTNGTNGTNGINSVGNGSNGCHVSNANSGGNSAAPRAPIPPPGPPVPPVVAMGHGVAPPVVPPPAAAGMMGYPMAPYGYGMGGIAHGHMHPMHIQQMQNMQQMQHMHHHHMQQIQGMQGMQGMHMGQWGYPVHPGFMGYGYNNNNNHNNNNNNQMNQAPNHGQSRQNGHAVSQTPNTQNIK